MPTRRSQPARLGWLVRLVAVIPMAGALVLSFANLADLARSARIDGWLAYLWPGTLDATGVVATLIWLDPTMSTDARRSATRLALAAVALSIGGNSLQHWLLDSGQRPDVVIQMAIAAVPPAVLFAMLHVLHQAQRRPAPSQPAATVASAERADQPAVDQRGQDSARWPANPPAWSGRISVILPPTSSQPALPASQPGGSPLLPAASHPWPATDPAPAAADHTNGHAPASQPTAGDQPPGPSEPTTPASQPPPRTAGTWRDHIPAARELLASQPDIGRPRLADQLGIPTSQARKLLDHLAPLKTGQR